MRASRLSEGDPRPSILRKHALLNHGEATRQGQGDGRLSDTLKRCLLPGGIGPLGRQSLSGGSLHDEDRLRHCAKAREDFDLAAPLLDAGDPSTPTCCGKCTATRARSLHPPARNAKRTLLALIGLFSPWSRRLFEIRKQRDRAERPRAGGDRLCR